MKTEKAELPKHIAIIMDGNRRWAKSQKKPALDGHRHVANVVLERLIEHAAKHGISYVTLWAFSTENWQRDPQEVHGIMGIFRHALETFGMRMHKKGIRIRVVGDISRFDDDIRRSVQKLVRLTRDNTRITVIFALNYGGRDEILRTVQKLLDNPEQVRDSKITDEYFSGLLDSAGFPDPDFIIRTGGEHRTSGFLLWQAQYSEWYFPTWYMPDFTPERLDEALAEYTTRKRRYGK